VKLSYITREMGDPRGRPKVFFSCHPDDFADAFALVTEDVLQQANCVIWYDADMGQMAGAPVADIGDTDIREVLGDMQLLALAVTSRFLEEPNRARDVELPYALERHIPVLPIMLENELEYEFNEKCAPVQVVNRYVTDSTATPYEEVLRTFLSSVLVGDELSAKVRDAFDAYVFLSYRKKNRRQAQRLMRIIHEKEDRSGIAIWYDEYLVPGEGFDEAIKDAFQKSSLFALAVTQQLLEEGNYVETVEYPMAHSRKRDQRDLEVVPVEMYDFGCEETRTDLGALASAFEDLPKVQDEYKRDELHKAIDEALENAGVEKGVDSSQRRYLIGLAYLNGIDVEPDFGRAVDLLTHAATDEEEPCMNATEKLVDMYQRGDGVKQDMDEAIRWQRLVVRQYAAAYRDHHDPDEHKGFGTKYFKALVRLSDLLREMGDVPEAITICGQAFELSRELAIEVGVRESERDRAVMLNRLGDLHFARKDYEHAYTCYSDAKHLYGKLASALDTVRSRRDFSISLERLGDVRRAMGDLVDAENLYRQAGEIRKALAEADLEPRSWRGLSSVYTKLGDVRKDGDDFRGALHFYSKALEMDRKLAEELRTPQATDDLAVSLIKVGDIAKKRRSFDEAVERYDAAEALYAGLVKKPGSRRYRKNHALCLEKLASACKYAGDAERAARCYGEADEELYELYSSAADASVEEAHGLAIAYFNHAQFAHDKELALKAQEIWTYLSSRDERFERYLGKADRLLEKLDAGRDGD